MEVPLEKYHIQGPQPDNTVALWSTARLPFEPKGRLLDMRNDLRAAIEKLKEQNDSILHAVYISELPGYCDVENILLYNVGSGPFAHLCRKGLLFERSFAPPPQIPVAFDYMPQQYHYYGMVNRDAESGHWIKGLPLASWTGVPCPPLKSDIKPHSIWYAMKQCYIETANPLPPSSFFGMHININTPANTLLNLYAVIKPLLDGIISAFHCHDDSNLDVVTERLSNLVGTKREEIAELLTDSQFAVLGRRRLLHSFGKGIQWNPADNMCVAA